MIERSGTFFRPLSDTEKRELSTLIKSYVINAQSASDKEVSDNVANIVALYQEALMLRYNIT